MSQTWKELRLIEQPITYGCKITFYTIHSVFVTVFTSLIKSFLIFELSSVDSFGLAPPVRAKGMIHCAFAPHIKPTLHYIYIYIHIYLYII